MVKSHLIRGCMNKSIFLMLLACLLYIPSALAATDDACKLYLCLMGSSESDGGSDCVSRIEQYLAKFDGSCPDLPTCVGTSGPVTSGVLMVTASGSGGSTQGPENGPIRQICVEEDTWWGTYCEIYLGSNAVSKFAVNEATCGGQ